MNNSDNIIVRIARRIGMDGAIAYSSGARIVQGATGVLSIFFISTFLTGVEQGFYYTFGSILALQVFFELGLTGIMTQYTAHEMSHLSYRGYEIDGDNYYVSRLSSLIKFCVKWYSIMAVLSFLILTIVGCVYFNRYNEGNEDVTWFYPWLLICIATAIKLFQSPFNSILMGLGKVKEMSKIIFYQQIIIPIASWLGLACGLKLYVLGIGYLISVFLWLFIVWRDGSYRTILFLYDHEVTDKVNYLKEIFPYQWRMAISGFSGYFIFQLFNPVLFATAGAVIAGQMGMTQQVLNAIQTFSFSWINTKVPLYSSLIAKKEYEQLDNNFNTTLRQMVSVCFVLLVGFFLVIWILNVTKFQMNNSILADRFLGYLPALLMSIPVLLHQFINSWATYLRCHKKEPFLVYSVCNALACALSTVCLGNLYGLYGVAIGYCVISLFFFPWGHSIFVNKKKEWHNG